jgi:diadenosine tetraphosphatase ApaH/serine/threonine PP2A family protein phosphatase
MRALILSDVHGNLEALTAVLAAAEPYDVLWNLGDLVGYGASPNQVLDLIRLAAQVNVRGNHDRVCCGLTSALGFNPVARAAAELTKNELTPENMEWLRAVPQGPVLPEQAGVACVHGSPLNEDQYILSMRDAWAPLQKMAMAVTFFGHTHLQGGFSQKEHDWHEIRPLYRVRNEAESWAMEMAPGTRHLINPGSVGQPRDNDWRAAFAIYDTDSRVITFHRVPYDLTTAQGRILMAGLPERLAARLREGR